MENVRTDLLPYDFEHVHQDGVEADPRRRERGIDSAEDHTKVTAFGLCASM